MALKRADEIIKNTYRTLMTRGMKGCYIYCTDPGMREYIRKRLAMIHDRDYSQYSMWYRLEKSNLRKYRIFVVTITYIEYGEWFEDGMRELEESDKTWEEAEKRYYS